MSGAAAATAIALLIFNGIKFEIVRRKFGIQPFQKKHLEWLLVFCVVLALSLVIPAVDSALVDLLARSTFIVVIYAIPICLLSLSEDIDATMTRLRRYLTRTR